jgi:hypothetical protein
MRAKEFVDYFYGLDPEHLSYTHKIGDVYGKKNLKVPHAKLHKKKKKKESIEEAITFNKPQFHKEWDEASRYPEFRKIGKDAWIKLANEGEAVTITSAKGISNTDATEPDSFSSLDKGKQARTLAQLKSNRVEMPIVAVYSDGHKELVGGNTRLTALMAKKIPATVWQFEVPDEVANLAINKKESIAYDQGKNK